MQEFWVGRGANRLGERHGNPISDAFSKVPHVWTFAGDQTGRILFIFTPAGQMEAFFRDIGTTNSLPPLNIE